MVMNQNRPVIIMADDDEDDCLLVEKALPPFPCHIEFHSVKDGQELMDYLHENENLPHLCLILLDLNMPVKGGKETLAEIKSDPQLKSTPVVILTTSNDTNDILTCYELGANTFLTKPITHQRWLEVISTLCSFWFDAATLPCGLLRRGKYEL